MSFTPGWNDPPSMSSACSPAPPNADVRALFQRRVTAGTDTTNPSITNSSSPAPAPVQLPRPAVHYMMPSHSNPEPAAPTAALLVPVNEHLTNQQILTALDTAIHKAAFTTLTLNNLNRRLTKLNEALSTDSLSADCRTQLSCLISALEQGAYDQAYDIHTTMMVDFYQQVNTWMVAIKSVILECKKKG